MSLISRLLSTAAVTCAFILPIASHATPTYVDHADQNYWTNVDMGLDFLDLTQTLDNSYTTVVSRTTTGDLQGWRLATNTESTALYNSFAVSQYGWSSDNREAAHLFFELFGVAPGYQQQWNNGTVTGYLNWNTIYDADKKMAHVALTSDWGWFNSYYAFTDVTTDSYFNSPAGALLVRNTASSTTVPEPAGLALFGIALAGLTAARRRKQQ